MEQTYLELEVDPAALELLPAETGLTGGGPSCVYGTAWHDCEVSCWAMTMDVEC